MPPTPKNRLQALLDPSNTTLNGIDFVAVASPDQRTLRVHFLNANPMAGHPTTATITGGETIPTVRTPSITAADWTTDAEGRPLLTITVAAPGDFSFYTLTLANDGLDPFFQQSVFSFKANCPSDLDCAPTPPFCPPEASSAPPIDYLAKDFLSFRQALSDFSAFRYPEWQERSEADFGMMFLEALSSLADDLSYYQDRVAAEAALDTATQRRSLVRMARLVDYEPAPAASSRVLLQLDVTGGPVPVGMGFTAVTPDGLTLDFETGNGLLDPQTGVLDTTTFPTAPAWNRGLKPYIWDDSQRCLRAGSTEMWVESHGHNFQKGMALLIDTPAETPADPPVRDIVHLTADPVEEFDALFAVPVTHIVWSAGELTKDHALFWTPEETPLHGGDPTRTILAGNLVPATQGRRVQETFAIETPPPAAPHLSLAVARIGPNDSPEAPSVQYLYSLRQGGMAWLLRDDPADPTNPPLPHPEIALVQADIPAPPPWSWLRSLLAADLFQAAYTVDPASYRRIGVNADGSTQYEYDGDDGDTLRFGDGVFGATPDAGTVFTVTYRVGGSAVGNVAADTITGIGTAAKSIVTAVTNPFAADGGQDAESAEQVRRLAPQAFRARQFRAVLPDDYEAAAERLPWVQRAGTVFRWTGSWPTVFTSADPLGTETIPVEADLQLIALLNRYRLAGYESYAPAPRYVALDLFVTVCALPDAFRADVKGALLQTLSANRAPDGTTGFFFPDRFTFGTPLERSALEAAIQNSYGVAGVLAITYRRRGYTQGFQDLEETLTVGRDAILRVDNDPSRPERVP